jgi:UDP-glucose 6-dehydrogenase
MAVNKIGIIGLGFVGGAVASSFNTSITDIVIVDTNPAKCFGTYKDLMSCEGIFVCVPSPSLEDGSCDTGILESVLEKLKDFDTWKEWKNQTFK